MDRAKPQNQNQSLREMAARARRLAEEAYRLAAEARDHAAVAQRLVTRGRLVPHSDVAHQRAADAAPERRRSKRSRSKQKAGG